MSLEKHPCGTALEKERAASGVKARSAHILLSYVSYRIRALSHWRKGITFCYPQGTGEDTLQVRKGTEKPLGKGRNTCRLRSLGIARPLVCGIVSPDRRAGFWLFSCFGYNHYTTSFSFQHCLVFRVGGDLPEGLSQCLLHSKI